MSKSFEIINENGAGGTIILCCHASNHFPPEFGDLGLSHIERHEHIAHDIGALALSIALSQIIDAPIVHSKVSRLVIDCNRDPTDFDAIPDVSAGVVIAGNQNLDETAKQARVHHAYHPYHNAIDNLVSAHSHKSELRLLAIHSFTPNYMGQKRELDIGVLIGDTTGFGDKILSNLQTNQNLQVERDAPYDPNDRVYHTLNRHAVPRNLPSAMLEIRNDYLQHQDSIAKFAQLIAGSL